MFKSEKYLEQIIMAMPGHVYWKDQEGYYLGCNKEFADSLNLSSCEDILGKTDFDFLNYQTAKAIAENDNIVLLKQQEVVFEEEGVDKFGQPAVYITRKVPLFNENGIANGVLGISLNITDRKHVEQELKSAKEAAEKMVQEKKQILRNMEHDIRTPFSGISSIAEIMLCKEQEPEKRECLTMIRDSSLELLSYCNKFIEFARIEDGLTAIIAKKFDLKKLAESIVTMELPSARFKNLSLLLDYSESIPKYFLSDPFRIKKLLINLISNGIKFTNAGFVKLTIRHIKNINENRIAIMQLIVEDTGIGISQEHQTFIYEKLAKIADSNTNKYRGSTGLGLSMVKILIKELEGQIEISSELGKGTIFACTLPLELSLTEDVPFEEKEIKSWFFEKNKILN